MVINCGVAVAPRVGSVLQDDGEGRGEGERPPCIASAPPHPRRYTQRLIQLVLCTFTACWMTSVAAKYGRRSGGLVRIMKKAAAFRAAAARARPASINRCTMISEFRPSLHSRLAVLLPASLNGEIGVSA